MGLGGRWGIAVAGAMAGFALAWWVCARLVKLDEGVSLGIAGAVLTLVLAVAAWWAPQGADDGAENSNGRKLVQKARAGRNVYQAGRDMKISRWDQGE